MPSDHLYRCISNHTTAAIKPSVSKGKMTQIIHSFNVWYVVPSLFANQQAHSWRNNLITDYMITLFLSVQ